MIILLVEDDVDVASAVARFLELRLDAEVVPVMDVAAALEALQLGAFDLVVTDFRLPDGTGDQVVRAVRALTRPTPVVLHSGDPDVRGHGADAFVLKPADMTEFAALCERLVV